MINKITNNRGITLVELLATLAIVGIVATLAYTILFQGYSNFQRVKVETELRDEADIIMASFIKDLFVLKKSEVQLIKSCTNENANSYLQVSKINPATGTKAASYITGFNSGKALVKDLPIQSNSENIELVPYACTPGSPQFITLAPNGVEYTIKFSLRTKNSKKQLQLDFTNTINIIDDTKEGITNASP